jgi:glycerophosphoryl diester phosphodiesterase
LAEPAVTVAITHATGLFHRQGLALDVWTLDAGTPRCRERLARVVAAGIDMITTNTPRELAAAGRTQ